MSKFVADFLNRKDAELARAAAPKKGGKAKKAAVPQPTTATSIVGRPVPGGSAPPTNGSVEWSQVPVVQQQKKAVQQQQQQQKAGAKGAAAKKGSGFSVLKPQ